MAIFELIYQNIKTTCIYTKHYFKIKSLKVSPKSATNKRFHFKEVSSAVLRYSLMIPGNISSINSVRHISKNKTKISHPIKKQLNI